MRVAVARTARPDQPWHDLVVESIRQVDGVEAVLAGAPTSDSPSDIWIDLSGARPPVDPPFGVWRFGFGDGAPHAGAAPGTLARLYRLTADPARAVVLHEGWYRSRSLESWGTTSVGARVAGWCARALRQITLGDRETVNGPPQSIDGCRNLVPPAAVSRRSTVAGEIAGWLTRERWTIGLAAVSIEEVMQRGRLPAIAWMGGQPADRFFADPFPLSHARDPVRLIAEEYHYASRSKRLVELAVARSGRLLECRAPGLLPVDASYPFVRREGSRVWCIPETFRARSVSAFVSDDDGRTWRRDGDLLEGFPAVDSTLVEHEGLWWLFCTRQGDEDQTDLHLFFAAHWRGPWAAHPLNPVKSDTRSSRPAGALFRLAGSLYRPAQDCSRRYGGGVTVNRIEALSPHAFRETAVAAFGPDESSEWPHGLHTLNGGIGYTVVDGLRLEPRLGPAAWSARARRQAATS